MRPYILLLALLVSCSESIIAPDLIELSTSGDQIFISDRSSGEIIALDGKSLEAKTAIAIDGEALALKSTADGLIVLTDGEQGRLHIYNEESLALCRTIDMGYAPSSIAVDDNYYWVTQRYGNELWRVDIETGSHSSVATVREPVGVVAMADGRHLMVANSLPHQAATDSLVAASLSIVDGDRMVVTDTLYLPNGSTDLRSIICDHGGRYCYLPHAIGRYQLPTNQLDRGWMTTSALTIFDLEEGEIVNTILLDTPQRGAQGAWSGAISSGDSRLYLSLSGSGEVMTISLTALHDRLERAKAGEQVVPSMMGWKSIPNDAGFLYGIRDFIPTSGRGSRGITIVEDRLLGVNYFSAELFEISLNDPILDIDASDGGREYALKFVSPKARVQSLGRSMMTTSEGRGEAYFHDATLSFQNWQSCASCHPSSARVDGLNWDLLNDGAGNMKQTKSLLYTHKTPPAMVTGVRESAYLAVRSGFKYILFTPSVEDICSDIDNYLLSLEALPSPHLVDGKLSDDAIKGKALFDRGCSSCHSGEYYTDMSFHRVEWSVGSERDKPMDTPSLRELWRTAPYLYDGRAATIREVIQIHQPRINLSNSEIAYIESYLLSL